jgi:hypothetical protein
MLNHMENTSAPTAHIPAGFRPEDGFCAVELTEQPVPWPTGKICHHWLALDLNSGALTFGDTGMYNPDRAGLHLRVPGYLPTAANDDALPPNGVMVRLITNHGYDRKRYPAMAYRLFDAQTLYDLAVRVLPMAQRIVESMHRFNSGRALEWSAAAISAWRNLVAATDYSADDGVVTWEPAELKPVPPYMHEVSEFIERHPELVDPAWVTASDAELDAYAAYRPHSGYGGVVGRMCTHDRELYADGYGGASFYGDRAALYAYRARAAGDLTVTEAEAWLTDDEHGKQVANTTVFTSLLSRRSDAELEELESHLQAAAAARGLRLVGASAWLKARRAAMRQAVEQRLARLGAECNNLEHQLTVARRHRAAELTEVLSWNDGRSDVFLGKLAGMSHTAVKNLRDRLEAEVTGLGGETPADGDEGQERHDVTITYTNGTHEHFRDVDGDTARRLEDEYTRPDVVVVEAQTKR